MATVSGTVKDSSGAFAARVVRLYRVSDGAFAGQVVSNATTGVYSITALDSSPHIAIKHDGEATAADANWANAILAMRCNGANNSRVFTDLKGHPVVAVGDTKIITSLNDPFGNSTGVANFDGSVDYLVINPSPDFDFASSNFAFRFRFYPTDSARRALVAYSEDFSIGIDYHYNGTRNINIWASSNGSSWDMIHADGGGAGIGALSLTLNSWNDIIFQRNGTNFSSYINGTRDVNISASGSIYTTGRNLRFGIWGNGGFPLLGNLSNIMAWNYAPFSGATVTVPSTQFVADSSPGSPSENAQTFDYVIPT